MHSPKAAHGKRANGTSGACSTSAGRGHPATGRAGVCRRVLRSRWLARADAAQTSGAVDLPVADRGQHHEVSLQILQVLCALVRVVVLLVLNDGQDQLLVLVQDALHHVRRQVRLHLVLM
jgi:hypothetical protein